ncbi:unnamed protein product, partial [Coregonus sp. 'balchen']
ENGESNRKAVDLLIDTIIRIWPHPNGWFREFEDALSAGVCKHAAIYMEDSPPSPSLEAENDNCVRLIELLLRVKTTDACFAEDILFPEDREIEFSIFLKVLQDTEHPDLFKELIGNTPVDYLIGTQKSRLE